jgi:hypothetical protein
MSSRSKTCKRNALWGNSWTRSYRKIARKRYRARVRADIEAGRYEMVESHRDRCFGWYW